MLNHLDEFLRRRREILDGLLVWDPKCRSIACDDGDMIKSVMSDFVFARHPGSIPRGGTAEIK